MKSLLLLVDESDVIVTAESCIISAPLVDSNAVDLLTRTSLVDSNLMIFGAFFLTTSCCPLKFRDIVCSVTGDGLLPSARLALSSPLLIAGTITSSIKLSWAITSSGIWDISTVRFSFEVGNNASLNPQLTESVKIRLILY